MLDVAQVALLAVTALGAIAVLGVSLRHVVKLTETRAQVVEAVARAERAEAIAERAEAAADSARAFAEKRADTVHAQYLARERKVRQRARRGEDPDDDVAADAEHAAGADVQASEIADWYSRNGGRLA